MRLLKLIFLLSFCFMALGQTSEQMYFLQFGIRESDDLIENNNSVGFAFPFVIHSFTGDRLRAIDTIEMPSGIALKKFMHLKDYNTIFFEERNFFSENLNVNSVFTDYSNDSVILNRYNTLADLNYKSYFSLGSAISIDSQVVIANEYAPYSIKNKYELIAIDKNLSKQLVTTGDFKNIYMPGHTFNGYKNYVQFYKYLPNELDVLQVTIGAKDYASMTPAKIQIPLSYRDSSISKVVVEINNSRVFVGSGESLLLTDSGFNIVYKWIFDKETLKFDSLIFPSEVTYRLGNDGDWIYGTSILKKDFFYLSYMDEENRANSMFQFNELLTRGNYNPKLSNPPFLADKTGSIFIYHLPSKKVLYLSDLHRDLEIFGVKDDFIYYRTYDEIHKAKLLVNDEEISVEDEQVIAKDKEIVPYLHCMFFSDASHFELNPD